MGRRSEPRIVILISVIVRGTDARGNASEFAAETCDISVSGARLRGVASIAAPGNTIEIECKGKKASYRSQWVGEPRTLSANQAGFRLLDPGQYIWSVPSREWAADTFDTSQFRSVSPIAFPATLPGTARRHNGEDRRRFPRALYRVETQIMTGESRKGQPGTVTDISFGGCYVEMIGPPPINTDVALDLRSGTKALHLFGTVRTSQAGFGMGVEFSKMSAAEFETLQSLALISPAAAAPSNPASQPAIPQPGNGAARAGKLSSAESNGNRSTTAESLDAVLSLLFRKGLITRQEIAEEIESMKAVKVESLP